MINILTAIIALFAAIAALLVFMTQIGVFLIERRNPPIGKFVVANDTRFHVVHTKAPKDASLPPVVFIHGASGNLRDQMVPLRHHLEGEAELLFLDRPGHGWSERGPAANATPSGQARSIVALMDKLGMSNAIIVGHSFGGGIAATLALEHPEKVSGLLFLAAATHPWPGGKTSWYYPIAAHPVLGRIFTNTIALPAGLLRMQKGIECVFAPNPATKNYARETAIPLVLRPANFRYNAIDVESLYPHVKQVAGHYPSIAKPTVIISGDSDTVVYEEIHSLGLTRDIPGSKLIWIRNLGHKPDHVLPELVVAAIEEIAGSPARSFGNLDKLARRYEMQLENQIQAEAYDCDTPAAAPDKVRLPGNK